MSPDKIFYHIFKLQILGFTHICKGDTFLNIPNDCEFVTSRYGLYAESKKVQYIYYACTKNNIIDTKINNCYSDY